MRAAALGLAVAAALYVGHLCSQTGNPFDELWRRIEQSRSEGDERRRAEERYQRYVELELHRRASDFIVAWNRFWDHRTQGIVNPKQALEVEKAFERLRRHEGWPVTKPVSKPGQSQTAPD